MQGLFEALRSGSGAGLAIGGAGSVGKCNLGVGGPFVRAIIELNRLRDGLCSCHEARRRGWRCGEIDKGYALGQVGVVALELPNAVSSAPLTDGKGRIRSVLDHRFPVRERQQRSKGGAYCGA